LTMKNAFDLLSDHVVITDGKGRILYANPAAVEKTGFSPAEMLGHTPGELWGGSMPAEFYKKMWQTITVEKKPFVGEVENITKAGKHYWQELHITPVLDETGEAKFFIAIEPDITDKKEKEKFRSEFISKLAHQIKSPLTATKWGLDLLLDRGVLDDSQRKTLQRIYDSNTSLIGLIDNLVAQVRLK